MKEVTIKIDDEIYGFYKSLGEDFEKSVEETISLAVWNHYTALCNGVFRDFVIALREGRGGNGEI